MDRAERVLVLQRILFEWLPQDKPLQEHGYWFPDCAYLKYIKGPFFYHECLKYYKERHLTTDTVDTQTDTPECSLEKCSTPYTNVIYI
jgi:hypothetical protein